MDTIYALIVYSFVALSTHLFFKSRQKDNPTMNRFYKLIFCLVCALVTQQAQAQYTFTDGAGGLNPYQQNFDALNGSVVVSGNHLTGSLPEVYAQAEFSGAAYNPPVIQANDGSSPVASYYHFGYASGPGATDRALGGIAATTTINGIGYVGIRFKNTTTATTIKNLEIQYAMEQWYNSGRLDGAQVSVSYLKGPTVTSLLEATGAWQAIPPLLINAPSTATVVANRDGNSPSNRRVSKTTVADINLQPGEEVMVRWAYTLNTTTNGNGLSIDDVVVTPETNVFYAKTTGDLNNLATWGISTDGSGTQPANFTDDNQTFIVQSSTTVSSPDDRIGTATGNTGGSTWTVSGLNSKIVVGLEGATPSPAGMVVLPSKNVFGTIDIAANSYFGYGQAAPAFTLGSIAVSSTVEYANASSPLLVQANQYGNLIISGAASDRTTNPKTLAGHTIVAGTLTIVGDASSGSNLVLGNNDLTVLSSGRLEAGSATAYVVTNGTGRLCMLVPRANAATGPLAATTFPVGSSVSSYTPVTLQQTSTNSDDTFEVRVIDGVYKSYAATTYEPGPEAITSEAVNKTWLISKEVPANPTTVSMTLQWNSPEAAVNFATATAHINHYSASGWDNYKEVVGVTGAGPFVASRTGITAFSPFSVSSRLDGALPVELLSFEARRTGTAVTATWATASEKNSDYFTLERSANGSEFTAVGKVQGARTSMAQLNYTFVDKAPLAAKAYYRLRQTDADGTFSFSPVVTVKGTATAAHASAVPNPGAGQFEIWIPAAEVIATEVTTVVGARVAAQAIAIRNGHLAIDLSTQPVGAYLIRLQTATGTQVVRVIKN